MVENNKFQEDTLAEDQNVKSDAVETEDEVNVPMIKPVGEVVPVVGATDAEGVMRQIEDSSLEEDVKAETLCRWAAARAGVIVVAPLLGTVALMANEVYLVSRLAKVYDKKITEAAAGAFIAAISGTVAGNILATLIPLSIVQVPIAVGVTYAVGKAAQAWLKDGMPKDMSPYIAILQDWKERGTKEAKSIAEDPLKNIPLGDESKEAIKQTGEKVKNFVDDMKMRAEEALEYSKEKVQETAQTIKTKAQATVADVATKIEEKAGATKERFGNTSDEVDVEVAEMNDVEDDKKA